MFPFVYIFANAHSFFGTQEGDFSLSVTSISAFKKGETRINEPSRNKTGMEPISPRNGRKKADRFLDHGARQGWLGWLFGQCVV